MANLTSTSITYTPTAQGGRVVHRVNARQKAVLVSLAFGDGALTYPLNGIPLSSTPSDYGLIRDIQRLELVDMGQRSGAMWKMDHTAKKILGYNPNRANPLIVDEVVTLTSSTGTLATPPAYILSVVDSDSNPMGIQEADIAVGSVKAAHCSVNFVTGVMNTLTGESLTKLTVTYIPQLSKGFFAVGNMVIAELGSGSGAVTLANRAALVQLVTEPGAAITLAPSGLEQAVASGEVRIVMNSSGDTILTFHADETGTNNIQTTYLKFAGIPTAARARAFIDAIANGRALVIFETASEVYRWSQDLAQSREYLVIPGQGVHGIGAITTTNDEWLWLGPTFPAIENEGRLNIGANEWETAQTTALDMVDNTGLELTPDLLEGAIELFPNVDAPEAQTLWVMAYGW